MTHDQLVSTLGDNYVAKFQQDMKEAQKEFDEVGKSIVNETVQANFQNLTKGYELGTI
jgi:hypothetical protein